MNRFNIGRRIEAYRDRVKMSTQELAGRIKRSQATISRIENGKQGVSFELLACIAAELHVHPFALLSDDPPPASPQEILSHIRHIIKSWVEGEEEAILARIRTLLDAIDSGVPAEAESSSGEAGVFPKRLPLRMVDAEKEADFRGKMFRMAGANAGDSLEHNRLR